MNLILSNPSVEYGQAISHELWMLSRPRGISDNETSQFYCGVMSHPDGNQVAIGPIDGVQPVHVNADEVAFAELISDAVTAEEEASIISAISESKGGSISVLSLIEASPSLSPNLITCEQMKAAGWFSTEES
jgi:hypothetical protein